MAAATETKDLVEGEPEVGRSMVQIKVGQFLAFKDGRWYKTNDVNLRLGRSLSKIGVCLRDTQYEDGAGSLPQDIQTFTLRQFYQDPNRPTLDYTDRSLKKKIDGIRQYQGLERSTAYVAALAPALKRFEAQYKRFEAEHEQLEAIFSSKPWEGIV